MHFPVRYGVFLILFLLQSNQSNFIFGQVNTENMRKAELEKGLHGSVNLNYTLISGNSEYSEIAGGIRLDYVKEKFYTFAVVQYHRETEDRETFLNKGFAHFRWIYNYETNVKPEIFLQKEFSEFILLNDRNLIGAGLRFTIISEAIDEESKFKTYLGLGLMWEQEEIDTTPTQNTSLFRSTNYLSVQWVINELTSVNHVMYYQPYIQSTKDYRVLTQSALQVALTKYLTFKAAVNYRFDNQPPPEVKKYDLEVINGFSIAF